MTIDVKIDIKSAQVMPYIFDWIQEQGWQHIVDWRCFHPDKGMFRDKRYTFQFEKEEHATMFALRWM